MFKIHRTALSLFILIGSLSLTLGLPAHPMPGVKLRGECESQPCENLWQTLKSNFPEKIQSYQAECLLPRIIGLWVYSNSEQRKVVYLSCWEPKLENQERSGEPLGILPFPGYEAEFGVKVNTDDPNIQAVLNRNTEQVERIRFECATYGGDINILVAEDGKVSLQCYFQSGVSLVDLDRDYISDGENSRGTSTEMTEELKN